MTITHKINMDLTHRGITPRIQAVQGDALTRLVEISLLSNGLPWQIPGSPRVMIRYRRSDRVLGAYDTLAGGEPAYQLAGNAVTVTVAPDALAVPGDTAMTVTLISDGQVLSTFEITLEVQPDSTAGKATRGAESYLSGLIPGPVNAREGQVLAVEKLSPEGTVQSFRAVDLPESSTIESIAPNPDQASVSHTAYTITMSDGSQFNFTVKNGRDGKSAYEFAKEAGYPDSSAAFCKDLADNRPPAYYITLTGEESWEDTAQPCAVTAAKDFEEIRQIFETGRMVFLDSAFGILPLTALDREQQQAVFTAVTAAPDDGGAAAFLTVRIGSDGTGIASLELIQASDAPDALPNPGKLIFTGAVNAEYDGSGTVTVEIPAGGSSETETVLSDNLLDKSLLTKGQVFYYGSSGYQLAASTYSHYGFIPLRGAGTYRTKFQQGVHASTGARIALVDDNNKWVANAQGTCGEVGEDNNWVDFEFVVTEANIAACATKVAFDVYELFLGKTMIVKDRDYPSEYIPFGYIEVATDSGKKQNNELVGKTAVFLGDSICAGTSVGTDSPYYNYGWAGLIGEANRMNWFNYGKNGGTITHRGSDNSCIAKIADTAISEHPAADYIIFEGGCNDADQMRDAGLGVISSDYATFNTTTFSGALEALILKLVTAYPNAKIGYIIPQKMYTGYADYTAKNHIHRKFFDRAVEICRKWGIPVVDIWNGSMLNPKLSTHGVYYVEENGQHLTEAGYLAITPMIESWMRNMYTPGIVGGSGSGGVTSWNELTDKPFGESDNAELLPPTQFVGGLMTGALVALGAVVELVEGKTYTVNWNGVDYETVCFMGVSPVDGSNMLGLGNPAAVGGTDNNQPFVLGGNAQGLAAIPLDGSTSATVSIKGPGIGKIPTEYIPSYTIHVTEDEWNAEEGLFSSLSFDPFIDAVFNCVPVVISCGNQASRVIGWKFHGKDSSNPKNILMLATYQFNTFGVPQEKTFAFYGTKYPPGYVSTN